MANPYAISVCVHKIASDSYMYNCDICWIELWTYFMFFDGNASLVFPALFYSNGRLPSPNSLDKT